MLPTSTPTTSKSPTNTGTPTHEDICYICGNETNQISNPNQTVTLYGDLVYCSVVQAEALSRVLNIYECLTRQKVGCNCTTPFTTSSPMMQIVSSPTDNGSNSTLVPTFAPSTSSIPTSTGRPTYTEICYVCGSVTNAISNPNQTVVIYGGLYYCSEIQVQALDRTFDLEQCQTVQQAGCNCTTPFTPPSPTSSSLPLSQPTGTPISMNQSIDSSPTTSNNTPSQPTDNSSPIDAPTTTASNNAGNGTNTSSSAPKYMASGLITMSMLFVLIQSIIY